MNSKSFLISLLALVALATPFYAHAADQTAACNEGRDLKSVGLDYFQRLTSSLEIHELADPLYKFVAKLGPDYKTYLAHAYEKDSAPDGMVAALNVPLESVKQSFNRVECAPGDSRKADLPVPLCESAAGKVYPAAAFEVFLSQAKQGLHAHLYASSCLREGAKNNCLTIDLLNYVDANRQLDDLVKAKTAKANETCLASQKKSDGLGTKIIQTLKHIVEVGKVIGAGLTLVL